MSDIKISGKPLLIVCFLLIVLPLFYIVVGQFLGRVNNHELAIDTPSGSSHIVDAMARMIERELGSGFCPSSYVWPGHIRYDICGFQEGEQQIWQRVAMQLSDHFDARGIGE